MFFSLLSDFLTCFVFIRFRFLLRSLYSLILLAAISVRTYFPKVISYALTSFFFLFDVWKMSCCLSMLLTFVDCLDLSLWFIAQLSPNSWAILSAFIILCRLLEINPFVGVFRSFYTIHPNKDKGFCTLYTRICCGLFGIVPASWKAWKHVFFSIPPSLELGVWLIKTQWSGTFSNEHLSKLSNSKDKSISLLSDFIDWWMFGNRSILKSFSCFSIYGLYLYLFWLSFDIIAWLSLTCSCLVDMASKLDRSVLANTLRRKSKGKQAWQVEVFALRSSDPLANAPLVVPSSTSKVQSKKRRRCSSPNGVDVAQPSTSDGKNRDGRSSDHFSRQIV